MLNLPYNMFWRCYYEKVIERFVGIGNRAVCIFRHNRFCR